MELLDLDLINFVLFVLFVGGFDLILGLFLYIIVRVFFYEKMYFCCLERTQAICYHLHLVYDCCLD